MHLRHFALGAAGAVGMTALAAAAQAAPLTPAGVQLATSAPTVEKAAYRCRWHKGRRACRWVSNTYNTYAFSGVSAETLRAAASGVPNP